MALYQMLEKFDDMSIRLDTIQYHNITEQTGASGGRAEMLDTQKWALSAFTGIEVNS